MSIWLSVISGSKYLTSNSPTEGFPNDITCCEFYVSVWYL